MPSTYSSLKFELIATGEQAGTWGNTTNVNIGTAIEEAITGSATVTFTSGANTAIALTNTNAAQAARNLRLDLSGTMTTSQYLYVPAIEKFYIINNTLSNTVIVSNGSNAAATGTAVSVPRSTSVMLFNDGVNVTSAISHIPSLANVTITSGNVTVTNLTATSANLTNANVTNLTATSANLTNANVTSLLTVADLTDSSLTANRVVYAGTGGNLQTSANLTFDGTTLTANALTLTNNPTLNGGTANSVVYLNSSKAATANTGLQFDGANLGLGVTPSAWNNQYRFMQFSDATGPFVGGSSYSIQIGANAYINASSQWVYAGSAYASSRYQQFDGIHYFLSAGSGTAGNVITFTEALSFRKNETLALQGASRSAGTGIAFPAAVNPSSDVNTLDDYEEGDWTPTVSGSSTAGTTTYGAQRVGKYTKVGRQVTCTFRVNYTAATGTGDLWITGFPFAATEAIGAAMTDNLNWPNAGSLNWYIAGGTTGVLFVSQDNGAWQLAQLSNEAADLIGTITYFV